MLYRKIELTWTHGITIACGELQALSKGDISQMISLNILDYSPIDEGANAREALLQTTTLAKRAEELGYHRYWVAEHNHVLSVAGSSPEMLMMHLASLTESLRIGLSVVMLTLYSPYKVVEEILMLEALHPGPIDAGSGRSLGYRIVNRALNETKRERLSYEQQVQDLFKYLSDIQCTD